MDDRELRAYLDLHVQVPLSLLHDFQFFASCCITPFLRHCRGLARPYDPLPRRLGDGLHRRPRLVLVPGRLRLYRSPLDRLPCSRRPPPRHPPPVGVPSPRPALRDLRRDQPLLPGRLQASASPAAPHPPRLAPHRRPHWHRPPNHLSPPASVPPLLLVPAPERMGIQPRVIPPSPLPPAPASASRAGPLPGHAEAPREPLPHRTAVPRPAPPPPARGAPRSLARCALGAPQLAPRTREHRMGRTLHGGRRAPLGGNGARAGMEGYHCVCVGRGGRPGGKRVWALGEGDEREGEARGKDRKGEVMVDA